MTCDRTRVLGPIYAGDGAQLGPKAQLLQNLDAGAQAWVPLGRGSAHAPWEGLRSRSTCRRRERIHCRPTSQA